MPDIDALQYPDVVALISELDTSTRWPLEREDKALAQTWMGRAFRRVDETALRNIAGWEEDRDYIPDALPRRIAAGFADFLFAEDFDAMIGETTDTTGPLATVIDENDLPARLHRAERIVVSEGEAWWKLHRNSAVSDTALISWCSRRGVVPRFYGDRPVAAAFWSEVGREMGKDETGAYNTQVPQTVWRHVELHGRGIVVNLLYRGDDDTLGKREEITAHPATAAYQEVWAHGGPMFAGRVTNDLDDDDTLGESEFTPVKRLLLGLNEALSISVENARLTGKDRIMAAGRFTRQDGSFDASLEVFQVEQDGATMGEATSVPVAMLEKRYDAEPLWLHIDNFVRTILADVGLVPELVQGRAEGQAESGTAIRLRFLPTTNASKAKQRPWMKAIPRILDLMLHMPETGRTVTGADRTLPTVELRDPLPRDVSEEITDHVTAVTGEVESRRTAIKALHPDWTEQQVDEELTAILGEQPAVPPPGDPAGVV